jgi:hypothetical protein
VLLSGTLLHGREASSGFASSGRTGRLSLRAPGRSANRTRASYAGGRMSRRVGSGRPR